MFSVDGFVGPRAEASPVTYVRPGDLDQIQFGTVWRQKELINAMDARVVELDHSRTVIAVADQRVEEFDELRAFHRSGTCGVDQAVLTEVKSAHDVAFGMAVGFNTVGQFP